MITVESIRTLVVAGSPLARAGLAALLGSQAVNVIGQIADDADFADNVDLHNPDALIWDMGYEPMLSIERLTELGGSPPPILALVGDERALLDTSASLIRYGVRGILLQSAPAETLVTALMALAAGLTVLPPRAAEALAPAPLFGDEGVTAETLTPREAEVLNLIAEGLPNKTIALRLNISEHTVKFHVNAILTKLGAQSRTEAVVRATRVGLIAL
ncbi:response regulator transcription factor [Anaerolineae bacterium CFX9]|nr:response regulator transcription factor [Anaerolineae bacterium CFX9]